MRRLVLALGAAALLAGLVVGAVALARGGGGDRYLVRAIFDNAAFTIPGEDVKVAGVTVGKIAATEVTEDFKAALVLDIRDPGYQDFRADARCQVRPQSLIGEKFVECEPTQPRATDAALPPPLRRVESGPGEGQRLLPVENTSQAVDLDLVNNIMRRPYRERFAIILNELGTGLAGRGPELAAVVRRANPALRETDEVLRILAGQNEVLADLARDGDRALAPLARERRRVASAVENVGDVAAATAERREDLEADLERLPRFLAELRPTMTRLRGVSDELTPVLGDLGAAAPQLNRLIGELGPFSRAAVPAFETLGDAARVGTPALTEARGVVGDTRELAAAARPVGRDAARLLGSFERTGGIQELMAYLLNQVGAINGFDRLGHYLRANLIVNNCTTYAVEPLAECEANFGGGGEEEEAASARERVRVSRPRPAAPSARASTPSAAPRATRTASTDDAEPLLELLFGPEAP